MYLTFCVFYTIIEFVVCRYYPVDNRISFGLWHPLEDNSKWPNKFKLTGNTVCCCKSPEAPKKNIAVITLVNTNRAINCAEEKNNDADCYCYLSRNSDDPQKNANDSSCTSSKIYIGIGAVAVILLIAALICTVLLLKRRTGFVDECRTVRPSSNRRRITIIRRSFNPNSNGYNNKIDDTTTRVKYGSLRSNRENSHIYHSLDNVHMATEDSTPVINQEQYRGNFHWGLPRKDSMPARLPLKCSNVTYEEPITSAPGVAERDIHRRRPCLLPHENNPPANNLSSTMPLAPPPKKNLRPPPRTPTIPTMPETSPLTSELINLFNKRRLNENGSLVRRNSTVLPPPPPRSSSELARAPASHLDNSEDDWAYEEFINVSIYNVK